MVRTRALLETGNSMWPMDDARRDLVIRAAWLYYDRQLTQQQVADRLGVSRATVSRMLTQAEEAGIVRIEIHESPSEAATLAEELVGHLFLRAAHVGLPLLGESPLETAAAALARRYETICAQGDITIATGWGRTIARAAQLARPRPTKEVTFVDSVGYATAAEIAPAVEVTSRLARTFGARVVHIPAPVFASAESVEAIRRSPEVSRAIDRARSADVSVVSVGVVGPRSLLMSEDYLSLEAMEKLVNDGAVGEILGHYYDADGRPVPTADLHCVGLNLDDLRAAPRVIAGGGGRDKAPALRAAIAGGFVNEVVVDDTLALALLD